MHNGAGGTDHPAVLRALADHLADLLRLLALPYLHERLVVDVAHALLPVPLLKTVAGHHLAPRVDEEIHHAGLAGQHAASAFDIVDKTHVEPSPEPALGVFLLKLPFDELTEVVAHLVLVRNHIVALVEVVRVMESCGGELHAQRKRQLIERQHVFRVMVGHGAAETDVLQAHVLERQQRPEPLVEPAGMAAQLVVLLAQALDGDADTDIREFLSKRDHPVLKPAGSGNHDARSMPVALLHNLFQIFTDERLATRKVDEFQLRQRPEVFCLDLLLLVRGILPDIAHLATHRTAIRQNDARVGRTRNVCVCHRTKLLFFTSHQTDF